MTRTERNQRRFLLAQLNTMRRLDQKPELVRYHGSTHKLACTVARLHRQG